MKILGVESASLTASASLLLDGALVSESSTCYKKTHSETLLPMIRETMENGGTKIGELDAIAVSAGPGSFTGLRIGASIVKGLCFAADIPVIPVPTLDAMAYGCYGSSFLLVPILDARRGEVYTGAYRFCGGEFTILQQGSAIPMLEEIEIVKKLSAETGLTAAFFGDGIPVHAETIRRALPEGVILPSPIGFQRASSVALYGETLAKQGVKESAESFVPTYLRLSQAERERLRDGLSVEPAAGLSMQEENKPIS